MNLLRIKCSKIYQAGGLLKFPQTCKHVSLVGQADLRKFDNSDYLQGNPVGWSTWQVASNHLISMPTAQQQYKHLDLISISDKTSYLKISWSLETARLIVETWNYRITMKSDRHISSIAAKVPVKFQSDRTIPNTNLTASRLCKILHQDVLSDIETGPCDLIQY